MKITDVSIFTVTLPRRREHKWTGIGEEGVGYRYAIIKLMTDEGIIGYGEAPAKPRLAGGRGGHGETAKTTEHIIRDYLLPTIEGENPFNIELIHDKMNKRVGGYFYAKAAIDIALYDIMGKAKDLPVYQLLGGAYRKIVPICHSLGLMEVEKAVDEAIIAVKEGAKHIKIKVGIDPIRDIDIVQKVRKAVGPRISIAVDANQGYSSPKAAIRIIKEMEPSNIVYMEQPVKGLYQMRRVTHAVDTPIMADESVWTPEDTLEIATLEAADLISIYVAKSGGLFPARQVAHVAKAAGISCNVNSCIEFGVGNAASLHLIASAQNIDLPALVPVTNIEGREQVEVVNKFYLDDIIREPFDYDDGYLRIPEGPGLGIEIDEEKLHKYCVS